MKIVFQQKNRNNERQDIYEHGMPVQRKILTEKIRLFELEKRTKAKHYRNKTYRKTLPGLIKVFENEVETEVRRRPKKSSRYDIKA